MQEKDDLLVDQVVTRFPELNYEDVHHAIEVFRNLLSAHDEHDDVMEIAASQLMPVSSLKQFAANSHLFPVDPEELTAERVSEILFGGGRDKKKVGTIARLFSRRHARDGNLSKRNSTPSKRQITETSLFSFEEVLTVLVSLSQSKQQQAAPLFPFDPETYPKQSWDLMIMVLLLYTTFSVPYLLAFGDWAKHIQESNHPRQDVEPGMGLPKRGEEIFELCLDIVFCTDIIINFCTAFTSRGVYVTSMRMICYNYLKTW